MKTPEIPQDESSRLNTLNALNILDTLPEERFDRLTRMAKRLFGVPIALVSLVDENRQWFKSCQGLDAEETPRDISFCGHSILGDDTFVISDASQDERFFDNPLVLNAPHIRFYAGCPLKYVNGSKLGTLCIIDQKPRVLNQEDVEVLGDLAVMVEREIAAIQLATLDELTAISNRRGFLQLAEKNLSYCKRNDLPATLIFFDLDKFKQINDIYGHREGDRALTIFASQLKDTFRDSDLFARLGGDEFVVLLSGATKKQTEEIIVRFNQTLEDYNRKAKSGYEILCSSGIIEYNPGCHESVETLLEESDALMYRHKSQKKH